MMGLNDLAETSPELGMRHFDRQPKRYSKKVRQMQGLAAKEASYCQAVGYVPSVSLSNQDWEDQVHRNKISKARGGEYYWNPQCPRPGTMS